MDPIKRKPATSATGDGSDVAQVGAGSNDSVTQPPPLAQVIQKATKKAARLFAALPMRVIGDKTLSALDLRVLAAISFHDRRSRVRKQGAGCWAGNKKLAQKCQCDPASLSTSITRLVAKVYINREPHPANHRHRVFRVNFEEPKDLPNEERSSVDYMANGKLTAQMVDTNGVWHPAKGHAETVCVEKVQAAESADGSGTKEILLKQEEKFR
jgi:DNA-binding MarR family transcriptional regulator